MQKKAQQQTFGILLTGLLGLLLFAGCATSKPSPAAGSKAVSSTTRTAAWTSTTKPAESSIPSIPASIIQQTPRPAVICANDTARVRVKSAPGVDISDARRDDLAQQIQDRVDAKKALNTAAGEERRYEVTVTLTQFKTGSALGRLLSGKAGRVDIESVISIHLLPSGEKLNEFSIHENFSRGGLGGLTTSYEEAEASFVDGVAVALTGRPSQHSASNEWTLR